MIRARGLVKSFSRKKVLRGVDLDVPRGETRFIIGRSGGGKSVLLKHLLGLILPDAGQIWIDGTEITASSRDRFRMRLKFGMLFQGAALFDSLSVSDNVAFALVEHTRMTPQEIRRRVGECLDLVGLGGVERKLPSELSGGMRKRVGIARAISMKPEILLFDEPTSGLDPLTSDAINQLMIQLKEILKVTCVAVTHDMSSAFRVADQILLLDEGVIRIRGTPAEIRSAADPLVRRFIEGSWEAPDAAAPGHNGEKSERNSPGI